MRSNRVQAGVPSGGQFAAQQRAESGVSLAGGSFGDQTQAIEAARNACDAFATRAADEYRVADNSFPVGEYADAEHSLRTFQAKLEGGLPPEKPNKLALSVSTFRERLSARQGRRRMPHETQVADMREETLASVDQALASMTETPALAGAQNTDGFPAAEYNEAVGALTAVRRHLASTPAPPRISAPALNRWQSANVVNPHFSSWKSYNPMTDISMAS